MEKVFYFQLAIVSIFILLMICGAIECYISEKKDFNNGICPHCGKPLIHFDDDSQGGQGWCCHNCRYYTWISWFKR